MYSGNQASYENFSENMKQKLEGLKTSIVNDLTTGGSDKALSAESGKELKNLIDEKANGKDLESLQTEVTEHLGDYITHTGYAVATGSANNYIATLSPTLSAYIEGVSFRLKINVTNTGASTINVDGLGTKAIKKQNGNAVTSSNLKAGLVYTLVYDGTAFILQGEGGAGNAQPSDVLGGKTFTNDNGDQTGSIVNRGAVNITSGYYDVALPDGYYKGTIVNAFKSYPVVAGTDFKVFDQGSYVNAPSLIYTPVITVIWNGPPGTIRLVTGMWCQYIYPCYSQVWINNQAVGYERMNDSTSIVEWSQDFTVNPGDKIEIKAKKNYDSIVYIVNTRITIQKFDLVTRTQ
ncbi:hypothetical protein [Lysinibacillus xylanilyticus]|uniref:Uncharacterized protein n=1 Tax=Lysinibacillus xylanilyticus TaxID=582475 RepID=A0A2M9PWK6_9BACI|nr:hypothetical protein [Lysinibacillus xylanilyticus]PJO40082.1 hypothetical protein CWD94_30080 [Lysinibacillus xylanilyticus]